MTELKIFIKAIKLKIIVICLYILFFLKRFIINIGKNFFFILSY